MCIAPMAQAGSTLRFESLASAISDPALRWEPMIEGIEAAWLYYTPTGPRAAFLRYAAGARLQRHTHVGYEHIFVLTGSQSDDDGLHGPGTLMIHPPGSSHTVTTEDGCIVLAIWERPVAFGSAPLIDETTSPG